MFIRKITSLAEDGGIERNGPLQAVRMFPCLSCFGFDILDFPQIARCLIFERLFTSMFDFLNFNRKRRSL